MKIWLPNIRARSGADVFAERLAQGLRERGVEAIVEWLPHAYQYAPWLLRSRTPPARTDVIIANSWIAFAFCNHSIPVVATALHCVAGRGYPQWKSLPQAIFHDQLVRRFERASFRDSKAIVAISDSTFRGVRDDFGINDVHTIPLWINPGIFSPGPARYSSGTEPTRILIVGNMSRRKGGDLIAPFCNALGRDFDVTVVAGLRSERPAVSVNGAALRFANGLTTSQLVAAYRTSNIVVSLSRHEGFGYTALEGMACAKPIVAFDVSGLRDVIVDGRTGLLAPVENVTKLAICCRTLRECPTKAHALGRAGLQRALTTFSKQRAIDAHLQLYSGLIAR